MRWVGKREFGGFEGQRGFTLLETLIAVFLLGLIGTGVLTALNTNSRAVRVLDEQVVAANLATVYFEAIRAATYDNVSPNEYSSVGDNITKPSDYTVTIDVDYSDNGTAWVDTYTDQTLQRILVSVSLQGKPIIPVCTWRAQR